MLDAAPTAAKGLLQRARSTLARARPADAGQPVPKRDAELARRFAAAFSRDDVAGVVELLTDDGWLAMPPAPHEYRGAAAVAAFLRASADWRAGRHLQLVPTRANGQPAFGCYLPAEGTAHATGVVVLTVTAHGVRGITRFLDAGLHRRFELPDELPPR